MMGSGAGDPSEFETTPKSLPAKVSLSSTRNVISASPYPKITPMKISGRPFSTSNSRADTLFISHGFQNYDYIDTYITRENCEEYRQFGYTRTGIYHMKMPRYGDFFALCIMEKDTTWTVLQKRSGTEIPFWNRTFEEYANGFGSLSSDHWLGLDRVNSYIKRGHQLVLRIVLYHDLCDEKGKCSALGSQAHWWADWDFKIADKAQKYKLSVAPTFSGNLTDPLKDPLLWLNNGQPFTTVDSDNDKHRSTNCALYRKFGGWWHKDCTLVALNGEHGQILPTSRARGMHWTYQATSTKGKKKNTIVSYVIKPKYSLMMFRFK
uniref:Fibrinogen C-terminal domain-containing protein n=1 Tax=Acrobeloides nanus TaxID=290746 RepID=A0A914CVU0_9BILA